MASKGKLLTKPVYQSVFQRTGKAPTPTITVNGPSGSKVFLNFALPKDMIQSSLSLKQQQRVQRRSARQPSSAKHESSNTMSTEQYKLFNTHTDSTKLEDMNTVQNIGQPVKLSLRRTSALTQKSSRSTAHGREVSSSVGRAPVRSSSARQVDVSIPTGGEASSVFSSNSLALSEELSGHSCDLNDVRSDVEEDITPIPPTPVPEAENVQTMKERVHQNLLKTIEDTNKFLSDMDRKRRDRPSQIAYSDDEVDLDETENYSYALQSCLSTELIRNTQMY